MIAAGMIMNECAVVTEMYGGLSTNNLSDVAVRVLPGKD